MHHFFTLHPDSGGILQFLIFTSCFILCWNIENVYGLHISYKKWTHAFTNSRFILSNMPLQFLLGAAFALTIGWTIRYHFGVLKLFNLEHHRILYFLLAFLLLDFGEYFYHIVMHKVKKLWLFHMIHHSDGMVDVSTALREHQVENFIRNGFTLLWVFLSGVGFWGLLLRQIIQIASNIFAHVNYRLPTRLDNVVSLVFVTPNVHQVHHHFQRPYTDCNYGDVLSIWDRCFGTFKKLPASEVVYGVDTCMNLSHGSSYGLLIRSPFLNILKK